MKPLDYFHFVGAGNPDLTLSKMFGAECYKTANGKAAAIFYHDYIVVKLEPVEMEDALTTSGARLFEPMPGRPMNGWVMIPHSRKKEWPHYLEMATDFVKKLPAKVPKKKRS